MFTLIDSASVLAAAACYALLVVLPGYAIGAGCNVLGFRAASSSQKIGLAALIAFAILPAPLAVASSLINLSAAAVMLGFAALCGLAALKADGLPRIERRVLIAGIAWLALVVFLWIDIEIAGGLHQSLLIMDILKHAAMTRGIADSGMTPPPDPFFARDGLAVFYYFFFIVPAILDRALGGLIDARAAVGGLVVWIGIATVTLGTLVYRRAGLRGAGRVAPLIIALGAISSLQLIQGMKLQMAQSGWPNEMITPWVLSIVWVPHHVAAVLASWVALLLLIEADLHAARPGQIYRVILAGLALASAAGLSVWVTVATVAIVGLWSVWLTWHARWAFAARIVGAGLVSLFVAAPYLLQLVSHRQENVAPVAWAIRRFTFVESIAASTQMSDLMRVLLNAATLPLNYFYELGLLAFCGLLYWFGPAKRRGPHNDVAALLVVSVVATLFVGSTLRSTIANNDLGWRVMMFTQLALVLWTAHVLYPFVRQKQVAYAGLRRVPRVMHVLAFLGFVTVAYDLAMLRVAFRFPFDITADEQARPEIALDLRKAYDWMNANLSPSDVTQHNPARSRAYGFALYGRHRVGIADQHNAALLGADMEQVAQRYLDVKSLYVAASSPARVADVAKRHGVTVLVVTAVDPVWIDKPAWLTSEATVFATPNVRVIRVDRLDARSTAALERMQ